MACKNNRKHPAPFAYLVGELVTVVIRLLCADSYGSGNNVTSFELVTVVIRLLYVVVDVVFKGTVLSYFVHFACKA